MNNLFFNPTKLPLLTLYNLVQREKLVDAFWRKNHEKFAQCQTQCQFFCLFVFHDIIDFHLTI